MNKELLIKNLITNFGESLENIYVELENINGELLKRHFVEQKQADVLIKAIKDLIMKTIEELDNLSELQEVLHYYEGQTKKVKFLISILTDDYNIDAIYECKKLDDLVEKLWQ